ncbi:hypothetical protein ACGTNG_12680 [Halomonas sp. 1390]|uniref:hypothetical protein n=1 Tax=Halomonas sp. B23F22_3 TaxID=3459516 RepID=UPI00373EC46B
MVGPQTRQALEQEAVRQGTSVEQVFLDEMIEAAGPLKDQLYSLKRRRTMRVVE